jgi:predicted secreted protein
LSRASFAGSFLAGMASLQVVIRDGISNPLGAVAALAAAVMAISLVEKGLSDLQPKLDDEANKRADLADAARPAADEARAHAQKARTLLAKLEKMVRLETLLERQAVFNAPLLATTPAPSVRARMLAPARLAGFTKSLRQRVGTLRTDAQKLTLVRAPDVTPFRAKVSADFAAQFKGKSAAAAAATRDSLLAEARRRFAADPKTLAGVEKLITDASKVR